MKIASFLFFISFLFFFHSTRSVAQLFLNTEVRPRLEVRDGYRTLPGENFQPSVFVVQRNRTGIQFISNNIESGITLQNILLWGGEPLKTNSSSLGLFDAWIKMKIGDSIYIKTGRQELVYDNQRILSNNNWLNPGQRHDLMVFQIFRNTWRFDAGIAFNQESEPLSGTDYTIPDNYKFMNFLYYSGKLAENGTISFLSLTDVFEDLNTGNGTKFRFTNGGSYVFRMADFYFFTAGYLQNGISHLNKIIQAWYTNFTIGFELNRFLLLEGGIEVFSGNDYSMQDDTKLRSFEAAYGSGHGFNGSMDYFTKPDHTLGAGLVNPYFSISWKPGTLNLLKAAFHKFSLQNNYVYGNDIIEKYLGTEIDLEFKRIISDKIVFSTGYSVMFAGKSMEIIKNGSAKRPANWFYLSVTYKPNFLIKN